MILFISLWLLFWIGPANAQTLEAVCDPDDPAKCSQPLQQGEQAPFSGQLLTPKLAIALAQKAERFDIELELERERDRALAQIDLELEKRLRKLEADSWLHEKQEYERAISQFTGWYRNPFFVATVGMISGVLLTLIISSK